MCVCVCVKRIIQFSLSFALYNNSTTHYQHEFALKVIPNPNLKLFRFFITIIILGFAYKPKPLLLFVKINSSIISYIKDC